MLQHHALHADRFVFAKALLELVGGAFVADHDRVPERLAPGVRRRLVEPLLALASLLHRRPHGVVLVGVPDGRGDGARLRGATDDDRRPRLLERLRPDVVGVGPLPDDLGKLAVELVEPAALRAELEAIALVLLLHPAGSDRELDAAVGDVVGARDELRQYRRVAERDRGDERAEADAGRDGRETADGSPRVERSGGIAASDRAVVVGAEERVELRVLGRARERDPLRPGDAFLALDHEGDPHYSGVT